MSEFSEQESQSKTARKRQLINDKVIDDTRFRYLIGQYGEDRTTMLADTPAGKEGRVMHMAIDIFSKKLEPVFSPCDGVIVRSDYEEGFGEYGNYIIIQLDNLDFYFFFGHLSWNRPGLGRVLKGNKLTRLGDYHKNENGGWSRHLHIQILSELPPEGTTPNGYSTKEDFKRNSEKYPNPLNFFAAWKLQ